LDEGVLLLCGAALDELTEVLLRSKLDRFVSHEERTVSLSQLGKRGGICSRHSDCPPMPRSKRRYVPGGGVKGGADRIITGEEDLIGMNPSRGLEILSPHDYCYGS